MSPEEFDVVIVGGRCAGSALATFLARAGRRVAVVERSRFPADTPSTHGIQPFGVRILDELGVGDRLRELSPAIDRGTIVLDDDGTDCIADADELVAPMLNVRRHVLDPLLADRAAEVGAEVRTGCGVTGLLVEDGRVCGVSTAAGDLRARLVVGADGRSSLVARAVGAPEYLVTPAGRTFVWGYFRGWSADPSRIWLGKLGDNGYLASASDNGTYLVAVSASNDRAADIVADPAGVLDDAVAAWPALAAGLVGAERIGPVRVMNRWRGYFRQASGRGWVLVGDAGHAKDPTTGQGISDALRQARTLAPVIDRALDGDAAAMDRALARWGRQRDRHARPRYWFANDLGAPGPSGPLVREVQRRLTADPARTEALMRALTDEGPPAEAITTGMCLAAVGRLLWTGSGGRRAVLAETRELSAQEVRRRVQGVAATIRFRPSRLAAYRARSVRTISSSADSSPSQVA